MTRLKQEVVQMEVRCGVVSLLWTFLWVLLCEDKILKTKYNCLLECVFQLEHSLLRARERNRDAIQQDMNAPLGDTNFDYSKGF